MTEETIDGQQKYLNYKTQFQRLNRALANEFYLEAIFIEYAIMEDRTESVLRHAGLWPAYLKRRGKNMVTINSKIKFIQEKAKNKSDLLHKYFSDDLMDQVFNWKEKRNPLIHALLNQKLGPDDLKVLATEGNSLVRILRTRVANHNRAADQRNAAQTPKS